MSIQSQIDRVNGEVTDQKDLIARLRAILAGKVGNISGIVPSGTKTITSNGTHDVTNYENAEVNVPVGVFPSGTKTITSNGTHDVTNYASVLANIPALPTGISKLATGTIKYTSDTLVQNSIAHNMGVAPDFVVIFPESAVYPETNHMGLWLAFDIRRLNGTGSSARTCHRFIYWNTAANGVLSGYEYRSGGISAENVFNTDSFSLNGSYGVYFKANITYRWIAGKIS